MLLCAAAVVVLLLLLSLLLLLLLKRVESLLPVGNLWRVILTVCIHAADTGSVVCSHVVHLLLKLVTELLISSSWSSTFCEVESEQFVEESVTGTKVQGPCL